MVLKTGLVCALHTTSFSVSRVAYPADIACSVTGDTPNASISDPPIPFAGKKIHNLFTSNEPGVCEKEIALGQGLVLTCMP
jgi:hypothetical protein